MRKCCHPEKHYIFCRIRAGVERVVLGNISYDALSIYSLAVAFSVHFGIFPAPRDGGGGRGGEAGADFAV
jgi:hypothetical protein